jgi:methionyl-tRNA formyltransferase
LGCNQWANLKTGATTFFIEKEIDTGKIIDRIKIPITETDTAGTVHDRMMEEGAFLLLRTVLSIFDGKVKAIEQSNLSQEILKPAPKLFKENCSIDWHADITTVYNKIRGLSPYPAAWTMIYNGDQKKIIKIYSAHKSEDAQNHSFEIKQDGTQLFLWLQ